MTKDQVATMSDSDCCAAMDSQDSLWYMNWCERGGPIEELRLRLMGSSPVPVFQPKSVLLYQYNGYNGGFAQKRTLMWRCTLIGADGSQMFGGSWMSEGIGSVKKHYAEKDAQEWAKFLDWPLIDLGRCEEFDDHLKG